MEQYDLDELIAEWGDVYVDEGQSMSMIHGELFESGGLEEEFTAQPETDEVYRSIYSTTDEVMQAFSIEFTAKGVTTFKPTEQRLGEFKIDKKETPDKFRKTYLGFLARFMDDPDRSNWGVIEWLLRDRYIPKANDEFKMQVSYWGWQYNGFNAIPTVNGTTFVRELTDPDAPTPVNASMDGVHTQIAKWNAAGRTLSVTMGAWSADDEEFCTQIEEFVFDDSLNHLRDHCDKLFMAKAMARRYRNGRRLKYNINWGQVDDLNVIEDTEIKVVGKSDMNGSENVWMTPSTNRIKPTRGKKGKIFDIQKEKRHVNILGDWSYVLTFDVPEYIAHSEHDTDIDAALITAKYTEA